MNENNQGPHPILDREYILEERLAAGTFLTHGVWLTKEQVAKALDLYGGMRKLDRKEFLEALFGKPKK